MKDSFQVLNEMADAGVIKTYAIGGAIGAAFYIEASETADIDVFVLYSVEPPPFQELRPIYSYLKERGFRSKNEHVAIHDWDVQFLLTEPNSLREEAVTNANVFEFEGVKVRVILPEYLVADMLAIGRLKDMVRARTFLDDTAVDIDALEILIHRFGLEEKWKKINQL